MKYSDEQNAYYRDMMDRAERRGKRVKRDLKGTGVNWSADGCDKRRGAYDTRQSRIVYTDETLCDDVERVSAGWLLDEEFDEIGPDDLEPDMKWNGKPYISMK